MIVDEKGIKDSWKEYMEKLLNEENEWDHGYQLKLRSTSRLPQDGEVIAALKKMKRHKNPRFVRVISRNDTNTSYRRYWNSVVIGFM